MNRRSLLVVFDAPLDTFIDGFHALAVDGLNADVDVVAATLSWLNDNGIPHSGLTLNHEGTPAKTPDPLPLAPTALLVLDLGLRGQEEVTRHALAAALFPTTAMVNPIASSLRADHKHTAHDLWHRAGLPTPRASLIERPEDVVARLEQGSIYVLPDVGTEGHAVQRFAPEEARRACDHARRILDCGPCLVRQAVGDASHPQTVLRIHVAWDGDGFATESGFILTAMPEAPWLASAGRSARISGLHDSIAMSALDLEVLVDLCGQAGSVLNSGLGAADQLKFMGLDILWDWRPDAPTPFTLLEANARPAGLNHSTWVREPDRLGVTRGLFRWIGRLPI